MPVGSARGVPPLEWLKQMTARTSFGGLPPYGGDRGEQGWYHIIICWHDLDAAQEAASKSGAAEDITNNNKDDDNRWQTTNRQSGTKETARTDCQERVPATLSRQQELVMC